MNPSMPAELDAPSLQELAAERQPSLLEPRDHTAVELGRRIKMLRVGLGLTLKDIEARGGISATHVSEIERGKASPTVGALGRIAQALGLRPATLIEARQLPEVTVRHALDRAANTVSWGEASITALSEPTYESSLGLHRMTLPARREASLEHRHDGEEWVMVQSGVVELRVGGRTTVLREGDSLHFRAHQLHAYANLGAHPAVLIMAGRPRLGI